LNARLFFENFKVLVAAPDGVAKLREMVLQLAVQGKLVPQDPDDEPAEVLLERVKKEKERLVKEKKIRKLKPLPPIDLDEIPFHLPRGWVWKRLGEILSFEYGKGKTKEAKGKGGDIPVYGANGVLRYIKEPLVEEPCIIIGRKGSAGALNKSYKPCWPSDVTFYVKPSPNLDFEFVFQLLKSLTLENLAKGIKPGLNRNVAYELVIAIPPLTEQRRIVAKVDELMALCDRLEAQQQKAKESNHKLNEAALHELLTAQDQEELAERWGLIAGNFGLLYDNVENVKNLRQAILQLAVQGKLVLQDPDDEPAKVLLERIRKEKERLVKEGKIRKGKPLPPIEEDELSFEVPGGWKWVRFGRATYCRDGERIPVSKDDRKSRQGPYDYYGASGVIDKIDDYLFDKPLLLIGEDGANLLNRSTPIAFIARGKYWVNNHAHVLDGISEDFLKFIELHINAIDLSPYVTGSAQPKMNQAKMNSIPIALPPEDEQKRIVAKVDELMALCDTLKENLEKSKEMSGKLLEAVVRGVVCG